MPVRLTEAERRRVSALAGFKKPLARHERVDRAGWRRGGEGEGDDAWNAGPACGPVHPTAPYRHGAINAEHAVSFFFKGHWAMLNGESRRAE